VSLLRRQDCLSAAPSFSTPCPSSEALEAQDEQRRERLEKAVVGCSCVVTSIEMVSSARRD
jgi:hypothetical protein